jgi:hypothetical protein
VHKVLVFRSIFMTVPDDGYKKNSKNAARFAM